MAEVNDGGAEYSAEESSQGEVEQGQAE